MKATVKRKKNLVDVKLSGLTHGEFLSLVHALHYYASASPVAGDILVTILPAAREEFKDCPAYMTSSLKEMSDAR